MNSNLSAIRQNGFKALTNELGATGTVMFMRQFENGYGNYTEERDEILKDVTLDNIVKSIKERRTANNS